MLAGITMRIVSAVLVLSLPLAFGCGGASPAPEPPPAEAAAAKAHDGWFTDVARESGLEFAHLNGASGRFYYPEILGPGVAVLDFDNDGDLDVYLVQGGAIGAAPAPGAGGRLYRNDLRPSADGTMPTLRFTDVTGASGITSLGFGLGVAAADIDNDGYTDLYLTNFGPNQLYRNNRDGTFTDISDTSGTKNWPDFGVSAAFVDYDRDGLLDLYVGNNVDYRVENQTACPNKVGARDYCPPQIYGGRPDRLFRNLGAGRFADVTTRALGSARFGPALGVVTADLNGDGWLDIYVANDGEPNLLWINQRNGTFKETALAAGAAVTAEGSAEASMGVDAGDFDNDGDDDLVMTELTSEGTNLFINDGAATFRDASAMTGIGASTLPYTGWGSGWFDFDNDGWLDHMAVNGTIVMREGRGGPFPYDQTRLLLRNSGGGRFESVSGKAGAAFSMSESGRGLAFADIDNDGDTDALVGNAAGPVRLLINHIGNKKHWLGVRLVNAVGRDALGARLAVHRADRPTLWRRARTDGSYGSASDPRILVGLGDVVEAPTVEVYWPDGTTDRWPALPIDRYTTLMQGGGRK
jgi:hypothetical protein